MELLAVREPASSSIAPPTNAELRMNVQPIIVVGPATSIAPPPPVAEMGTEFSVNVQPVRFNVAVPLLMAPPLPVAVLPMKLQLLSVNCGLTRSTASAPPALAELSAKIQF